MSTMRKKTITGVEERMSVSIRGCGGAEVRIIKMQEAVVCRNMNAKKTKRMKTSKRVKSK